VAEAAGAAALVLSPGSAHPNQARALRASAGSLLRLPVGVAVPPAALAARLAEGGAPAAWAALAPRGGRDLWRTPFEGTLVVAVGAEGPGLSPEVASRAAVVVTIPVAAPVESLNAAVAAALVLFEIRRRRAAPLQSAATDPP
jgi:TrmH family RNA methyltransferase